MPATSSRPRMNTGFIWSIDLLSHMVRQQINALLHPLGLTFPKYAALRVLQQQPKLTNAAIARACLVRPQTMNAMVRDLEQVGLISGASDPEHSLKILYQLTPHGEELTGQADTIVRALENIFLIGLGEEKIQEMHTMLANTLERMQQFQALQPINSKKN